MSSVTAVPLRPIRRPALVALWAGIALLILAALFLAMAGTRRQVAMAQPPAEFLAANGKRSGVVTTPSGLQYQVLREGSGPRATAQDIVKVNYDGKLLSGDTFDSNAKQGEPATLPVGGLIPGWVEGLQLMNRGAKYRFWIPPNLAYGPAGAGGGVIPPNAVLAFDVELVDIIQRPPMGMMGPGGALPPGMEGMPQGMGQ